MDNLQIVSDNIYTLNAVEYLTRNLMHQDFPGSSMAIFLFEKKWLDEKDVLALKQCEARNILVFALPELHYFIHSITQHNNLLCVDFGTEIEGISTIIEKFLKSAPRASVPQLRNKKEFVSFTRTERRTIELVLSGESMWDISKRMNLGYKTVYSHKRNAMKKMGISNDAGLVHMGRMYMYQKPESERAEKVSSSVLSGNVNYQWAPSLAYDF